MVNLCQSAFAGTTVCLAASSIVATRQVGLTGSVLLVCNEFGRIDRGTAHRRASQFTKRCAHPHEPKGAFAVATSFSGSRPAAGTAASSPTATGGGGGLFLHAVGCVTRRVPAVLAGPTTNTPEVWEKEVYAVRPQINEPIPRPVHQSRGRGETIDLVVGPSVVLA